MEQSTEPRSIGTREGTVIAKTAYGRWSRGLTFEITIDHGVDEEVVPYLIYVTSERNAPAIGDEISFDVTQDFKGNLRMSRVVKTGYDRDAQEKAKQALITRQVALKCAVDFHAAHGCVFHSLDAVKEVMCTADVFYRYIIANEMGDIDYEKFIGKNAY